MRLLDLKPWHIPLRVTSGAFILQSGLSKRGMEREGDLRPTEQGTAIAKDVWMTAMGTAMLIDAVSDRLESE